MSTLRDRLILFTRYPEPGTAKTRLIPVLGPEGAAEFQRRLTAQAAQVALAARSRRRLSLEIRHSGGNQTGMRRWLGEEFSYRPQGHGDLGRRMEACLRAAFEEGAERTVLIGADIPALSPAVLVQAFTALDHYDLVFGPAADGGYYLVGATAAGFRRSTAFLGSGITWGAPDVLVRTLRRVRDAHLTCTLLETFADVDGPADLPAALQALCSRRDRPAVSVVIPALNEAGELGRTLAALTPSHGLEVIVVDGGSNDATLAIARTAGVYALAARPPRSVQMNAGAAAASGDALLFLHADTRLPMKFQEAVRRTLASPWVSAGAFRLQIDAPGRGLRIIEQAANWRSRFLQLPYGDQALFLRREVFWELGGFPSLPIMEDFEFIRRLKRRGCIAMVPDSVQTSPRRWLQVGLGKTWLINQAIIAAYFMGASTERLAAWYRKRA
ncbi:MAG: TIGR04283 family arsenosugar biosynthesis glycosyltransferase [Desulfobacterales bacterium]|nr:TIGR04283 family arsenosugar biosynthesis glycosyltransferase [Desulfobacterales bacterium]